MIVLVRWICKLLQTEILQLRRPLLHQRCTFDHNNSYDLGLRAIPYLAMPRSCERSIVSEILLYHDPESHGGRTRSTHLASWRNVL